MEPLLSGDYFQYIKAYPVRLSMKQLFVDLEKMDVDSEGDEQFIYSEHERAKKSLEYVTTLARGTRVTVRIEEAKRKEKVNNKSSVLGVMIT